MTFSSWDGVVARRLYAKRQWAWREINRFSDLLVGEGFLTADAANQTLINVGANIGSILVPLMHKHRFQRGMAFEPTPKTFTFLEQNIQQNGLAGQVEIYPVGLSNACRDATLELSPKNSGDHRVREVPTSNCMPSLYREEMRATIPISLATLDSVLDGQLERHSLLWVDIQGHEGKFLEGARRSLNSQVPVVTEFWPYGIARSGYTREMFCNLVSELFDEYFVWNHGWQKQPIDRIEDLYRRYESGRSGVDVLLI